MRTAIGDVTIPKAGVDYTKDRATVLAVQNALAVRNFAPKKGIDGVWGPDTSMALRSWEYESGSDDVSGELNYGVLLKLGVPAPGTTAAAQQVSNASVVADATARARAGAALDDANRAEAARASAAQETARVAEEVKAKAAVETAKAKVQAAPTAQAQMAAQQQLVVAEKRLEAVRPSFFARTPKWQLAVAGVGGAAIVAGIVSLFIGGKKRRK